ncbi:DUF2778 domain-containing protein [Photorhabdus luminescens]|uniref:tlde1 domain-containing protein n=1 Tax=Photorhabdus luminescens TaxID=29488 RepID=UPI000B4D4603|nr:tlde1 domain-containing protein [Photorhabdus luminescens]OWO79331.1 DUF2778 domain-containing protein [Photorhabdus luminescens]
MAWTYHQSTGEMYHNGELVETGYSGRMTNKNNPDRQQVKGLGPIPRGKYRIDSFNSSKGPMTIVLKPDSSNEMFGRDAFRIHGERIHGTRGWASEGCIILGPNTRWSIIRSGDRDLEVVK